MQSNTLKIEITQGSIAWALYPLTDKVDKAKRRPVLIISNDHSNELDNDYIVLPINRAIRSEPLSLTIEPEDVEGDLPVSSELRCNKPFTIRRNLITEPIGVMNRNRLKEAVQLAQEAIKMIEWESADGAILQ